MPADKQGQWKCGDQELPSQPRRKQTSKTWCSVQAGFLNHVKVLQRSRAQSTCLEDHQHLLSVCCGPSGTISITQACQQAISRLAHQGDCSQQLPPMTAFASSFEQQRVYPAGLDVSEQSSKAVHPHLRIYFLEGPQDCQYCVLLFWKPGSNGLAMCLQSPPGAMLQAAYTSMLPFSDPALLPSQVGDGFSKLEHLTCRSCFFAGQEFGGCAVIKRAFPMSSAGYRWWLIPYAL